MCPYCIVDITSVRVVHYFNQGCLISIAKELYFMFHLQHHFRLGILFCKLSSAIAIPGVSDTIGFRCLPRIST